MRLEPGFDPLTLRSVDVLKLSEEESRVLFGGLDPVAAAIELTPDKTVRQARLVLGGVATIPWRAPAAEAYLVGKPINEETQAGAAKIALEGAKSMGQNAYKIPLTQTLVRRALAELNA